MSLKSTLRDLGIFRVWDFVRRSFSRGVIRTKILTLVVVCTLVPALIIGFLFDGTGRRLLIESISEQLSARASMATRTVQEWFQERIDGNGVYARSEILVQALPTLRAGVHSPLADGYLEEVLGRSPEATSILIVADTGNVIAQTGVLSHIHAEAFRAQPNNASALGLMSIDGELMVFAQSPLSTGNTESTAANLVTVSELETLDQQLGELDWPGLPKLRVIGPYGEFVAAPSKEEQCCEDWKPLLEESSGIAHMSLANGGRLVAAYRKFMVRDLALTVIVEADSNLAFTAIDDLRDLNLFIGAGVLVMFLGLGFALVRQLTGPLEALTAGAEAIARGDRYTEVQVRVGGEIGYLTNVFNKMARNLASTHAALEQKSSTDELTSLWNRRHMNEAFIAELANAERTDQPLSVIAIDVDHFKAFNDRFGHLKGDEVLVFLGELLRAKLKPTDVAARYGGEEFIVILPRASLDEAEKKANEIRAGFASHTETHHEIRVSLSAGVSCWPYNGRTAEALIETADQALYIAKSKGRDRVEVAKRREDLEPPLQEAVSSY